MQPTTIRVRVEIPDGPTIERSFNTSFTLGRVPECDVQVQSGLVSRVHAEVVYEQGQWWLHDRNSTNGVFQEGVRISQAAVGERALFQLGNNGPLVHLQAERTTAPPVTRVDPVPEPLADPMQDLSLPPLQDLSLPPLQDLSLPPEDTPLAAQESDGPKLSPKEAFEARRRQESFHRQGPLPEAGSFVNAVNAPTSVESDPTSSPPQKDEREMSDVIAHYFDPEDDTPAGERTMMIRHAYKTVKKKEKRKYTGIIIAVGVLFVLAAAFAIFKQVQSSRQQQLAEEIFTQMKQQDLRTAQVLQVILGREDAGDAELQALVEGVREDRQRLASQYNGYVKELGLYRRLSEEEELIYRVARIFNESEFGMPAGFIREVRRTIREHWQGPGRGTFITAVERANENGYTPVIVKTMQDYGLPPEFFYLSMQESVFNVEAVGPATRWGIAKGMWQFIPSTAQRYGLRTGPRDNLRVVDDQDDRHDFRKATDAAARYLLDIYSTPAQASGLLVIASYNWGEHRVVNKLERLPGPQTIPEEAFEGIPLDPSERTYWRFLTEYSDRMPEETKDYVLKIFAAAVIGQNPRLFGFDFDNPLQPYMEIPSDLVE